MKILIFGNGYLGNRCHKSWKDSVISSKQINTKQDAIDEIKKYNPDVVFNAAGVKGKPNVDWCENNQFETMRGNTVLPLLLADACHDAGLYMLHIGSGCIFYGDSPHEDKKWRENDNGNPKPVYSRTKWAADLVLSTLPNVGVVRIRMPIDRIPSEGNLIDKLAAYPKIIDVENSVTIIDDLIEVCYKLFEKKGCGIFHATNPGTVKHKEIIDLYKKLVDPNHSCEWISNEDLVNLGLAKKARSNNFLYSSRLEELGIFMRPAKEALLDTLEKYAKERN